MTSLACLKWFKTRFSVFTITYHRTVSYLSSPKMIPLLHLTLVFLQKITCHRGDHKCFSFEPIVVSPPFFSDTIRIRCHWCIFLLLFRGGIFTYGFFIICPHCVVCLVVVLDSRQKFPLKNIVETVPWIQKYHSIF